MHIFLTGALQIGKSTIINKAEKELNILAGGFRTFDGTSYGEDRTKVYLYPASQKISHLDDKHMIAYRKELGVFDIYTDTFEKIGVDILADMLNYPLAIMDEIGFLESSAYAFQESILKALDGNIPILGVLRMTQVPFIEKIKKHPQVETIPVQVSNRDEVLESVIEKLAKQLKNI